MITFLDVLASVGFIMGDIAVIVVAAGSLALLVAESINLVAMRRVIYVPDILLQWSGAGAGFGILSAISMAVTPGLNREHIGLVFGLNYASLVLLLMASMTFILGANILHRMVPPNRTQATA